MAINFGAAKLYYGFDGPAFSIDEGHRGSRGKLYYKKQKIVYSPKLEEIENEMAAYQDKDAPEEIQKDWLRRTRLALYEALVKAVPYGNEDNSIILALENQLIGRSHPTYGGYQSLMLCTQYPKELEEEFPAVQIKLDAIG